MSGLEIGLSFALRAVVLAAATGLLMLIDRGLTRALPQAWPQVSRFLRTDLTKSSAQFWLPPVLVLAFAGVAYAFGRQEVAEDMLGLAAVVGVIVILIGLVRMLERAARAIWVRVKSGVRVKREIPRRPT